MYSLKQIPKTTAMSYNVQWKVTLNFRIEMEKCGGIPANHQHYREC